MPQRPLVPLEFLLEIPALRDPFLASQSWKVPMGLTPARCHSSRRRQQVYPKPYPNSCRKCIHAIPVSADISPIAAPMSADHRFHAGKRKRRDADGNTGRSLLLRMRAIAQLVLVGATATAAPAKGVSSVLLKRRS